MAYTLGNKCAKNLCKQTVLLQLIIENVVTCFFWNTVYIHNTDWVIKNIKGKRKRCKVHCALIVYWWMVVVEGENVLHHVKGEGNLPMEMPV